MIGAASESMLIGSPLGLSPELGSSAVHDVKANLTAKTRPSPEMGADQDLPPLRVLIIEDRESDAHLMMHELWRAGYRPQWHRVVAREEFLAQLDAPWDVILSDYNLPTYDALTALHDLQAKGLEIPFIVVTGSISEEVAVECMKEGATDYLLKDRLARLGQAVRRALHQRQLHQDKRRAENELRQSLAQKDLLLKEVHHRVKNNLQIAASMLNLQAQRVADPITVELLRDGQNRIRAMAMVHQLLYQSEDLSRVPFSTYIRDLVRAVFRSYGVTDKQIDCNISADDVFLNIETAMCCGLIVHELLSNALKHAFPKGQGAVWIEFRAGEAGQLVLSVRDNGVGMPANACLRRPDSLGLRLLDTLTRQLQAALETANEGGTSFRLTFKQLEYEDRR